MLAMEEAKLPPPKPESAEIRIITEYGVSGFCTATTNMIVGISSSSALITVQLRPPKTGTAKV